MIIPVRCFTCGTPIAQDWEEYCDRVSKGEEPKTVLDSLGYGRYCCRGVFLSHSETIGEIMRFKKF